MANSFRGKLYLAALDLSGDTQGLELQRSADVVDISGIDATAHTFAATLKDGQQFTAQMLWNNAVRKSSSLISTLAGTQQLIYAPNLDTIGEEAIVNNAAIVAGLEEGHSSGEIVAISLTMQLTGTVHEGLVLLGSTPLTSDGNQTGLDNGGSSSAGLTAWLQVLDITDMADLDVIIQMDTAGSFGSPTTSITFDNVSDASEPITQEKLVAGSIEQHLRVNVTFGTPGGSPSATILVAVKRG